MYLFAVNAFIIIHHPCHACLIAQILTMTNSKVCVLIAQILMMTDFKSVCVNDNEVN